MLFWNCRAECTLELRLRWRNSTRREGFHAQTVGQFIQNHVIKDTSLDNLRFYAVHVQMHTDIQNSQNRLGSSLWADLDHDHHRNFYLFTLLKDTISVVGLVLEYCLQGDMLYAHYDLLWVVRADWCWGFSLEYAIPSDTARPCYQQDFADTKDLCKHIFDSLLWKSLPYIELERKNYDSLRACLWRKMKNCSLNCSWPSQKVEE